MISKSIDKTFVHQGIRQDDLNILETVAKQHNIDFEWVKNLLQAFHEKRTRNSEIDDKEVTKLIEEHLQKINH